MNKHSYEFFVTVMVMTSIFPQASRAKNSLPSHYGKLMFFSNLQCMFLNCKMYLDIVVILDSMSHISTMAGSSASLPCNLTSSVPGDSVRLVLWFKGTEEKPIYTLDARGIMLLNQINC